MPHPLLLRLAAYGAPAAVATWRKHVTTTAGVPRLHTDPSTAISLTHVRVDRFSGTASATLDGVASLATEGVDLLALWQDKNRTRHWVHIRNGKVTTLDVPGDLYVGFLLSHQGVFRQAAGYAPGWSTAAVAMAADASPVGGARQRFITFDLDHVWTPATDQAPAGSMWIGGALDATDVEIGRFLADRCSATQFEWEPWTVDALAVWLDHEGLRACDVPDLVAATAGLPVADLAPALAGRQEPASHMINIVRSLAAKGVDSTQMATVIPGVFA